MINIKKVVVLCMFIFPSLAFAETWWKYTGYPCSGNSCRGWAQVPSLPSSSSINPHSQKYKLEGSKVLECVSGLVFLCAQWRELDNNPRTIKITTDWHGTLYQLHNNGMVWKYDPYTAGQLYNGWLPVDNNRRTVDIVAGDYGVLQKHNNGQLWYSYAQPCANYQDLNNLRCDGWVMIDNNYRTAGIYYTEGAFYQFHR